MKKTGIDPEIRMIGLEDCTLKEITDLWNEGFQREFSPVLQTPVQRLRRMSRCRIHPGLSVVLEIGGVPAGFVWIGWWEADGVKRAWNGGTGIIPAYRGQRFGKLMLDEAVRRVRDAGAASLSLEAMIANERAIRTYRSCGFRIVDRLVMLQRKDGFDRPTFVHGPSGRYMTVRGRPGLASRLPFYGERRSSWTSQWFSLQETDAEALLVYDGNGAVGYALFQEMRDAAGRIAGIELFQCEASPERQDRKEVIDFMLSEVMKPQLSGIGRFVHYMRRSNREAVESLLAAGFEPTKEEYLMELPLLAEREAAQKSMGENTR